MCLGYMQVREDNFKIENVPICLVICYRVNNRVNQQHSRPFPSPQLTEAISIASINWHIINCVSNKIAHNVLCNVHQLRRENCHCFACKTDSIHVNFHLI